MSDTAMMPKIMMMMIMMIEIEEANLKVTYKGV